VEQHFPLISIQEGDMEGWFACGKSAASKDEGKQEKRATLSKEVSRFQARKVQL